MAMATDISPPQRTFGERVGIMLLNIGTPDAPETGPVRRYLRQFLSDPRVLDIPALGRFLLLNLIILPLRPRKSAEAYRAIWTKEGSPLLVHGKNLAHALEQRLGVPVRLAMNYQNPSIASVLEDFASQGIDRVVVCGLYPQYASSSGGASTAAVFEEAGKAWNVPSLSVTPAFYDHPAFIKAFVAQIKPVWEEGNFDKLLMSFHGLPERHCTKSDPTGAHCLKSSNCCDAIVEANRHCYRAQSHVTARLIAKELGLADSQWEICFQSRLGRTPWIRPYTDERVEALPKEGVKRVAVVCPSFVSDCLETLEEIGMQAAEDFEAAGGEHLELIPCLNATPEWVEALAQILEENHASVA